MLARPLVIVHVNASEILHVTWDESARRVELCAYVGVGDSYRLDDRFDLAVPSLRPLAEALVDGTTVRKIDIGADFTALVVPRADGAVVLAIATLLEDGAIQIDRAMRLARWARRRLATGLDHARCAADPHVLDETVSA